MKSKRIIAVVTSVVLVAAVILLPVAASSRNSGCGCGQVLQVWVDGFGQPLFWEEGTADELVQGPLRFDEILPNVPAFLRGALNTVASVRLREPFIDFDPLAQGISELAQGVLGHLQMDEFGQSVYPISARWVIDPDQCHTEEPEFWFRFDYRQCPYVVASELNEFIETLVEQTGHQSVALTSHSQGGVIAMTYLAVYGSDRLDTLILANSGWQGLGLVGQLFTGQFTLSGESLAAFTGLGLLEHDAVASLISYVSNFISNALMEPLFEHFITPVLVQMPAVWAFVTEEYFSQAVAQFSDNPAMADLLATATRHHNEVMLRMEYLITQAMANGTHVAVIASYGNPSIPVTPGQLHHGDSILETHRKSGGATVAPFGKTLPAGEGRHRSPDNIIDASTAMLPDNTWFVYANGHNPNTMHDLRMWIIHADVQPTVWQNPAFPQFLRNPGEGGQAVPLG